LLLSATPDKLELDYNQYFRFKVLADEVKKRANGQNLSEISILDVGGGHGQLASFLPECTYVLVEPDVNGISGINLPFSTSSFDFVVSCHVLEHIPKSERNTFLDQKLSRSKRGIILLNPIYVEGTNVDERMDLFIEITDARWAKEHKECELPRVEEVRNYATEKGLDFHYSPKGSVTTSSAFIFSNYFSIQAKRTEDQKKINRFYNQNWIDIIDSKDYPAFGLFYIPKKD
jgi:SAM-dependent methyltransferase